MATRSNRRSQEDAKSEELADRRAVSIARAAYLYDVSKNTMRKILEAEGVLVKKENIHRVLKDDLIRVMEGEIVAPAAPAQQSAPLTLSNADWAAFSRASRKRSGS